MIYCFIVVLIYCYNDVFNNRAKLQFALEEPVLGYRCVDDQT